MVNMYTTDWNNIDLMSKAINLWDPQIKNPSRMFSFLQNNS